jgi:hypothetical protein
VVRELVGHGLGKKMHEEPEVPNFGVRGRGPVLKEGMVICIEPMINMGKKYVVFEKDGWTVRTRDRLPSAHFEFAVAITAEGEADVLTDFGIIDRAAATRGAGGGREGRRSVVNGAGGATGVSGTATGVPEGAAIVSGTATGATGATGVATTAGATGERRLN